MQHGMFCSDNVRAGWNIHSLPPTGCMHAACRASRQKTGCNMGWHTSTQSLSSAASQMLAEDQHHSMQASHLHALCVHNLFKPGKQLDERSDWRMLDCQLHCCNACRAARAAQRWTVLHTVNQALPLAGSSQAHSSNAWRGWTHTTMATDLHQLVCHRSKRSNIAPHIHCIYNKRAELPRAQLALHY
jgi:hypothetical protein